MVSPVRAGDTVVWPDGIRVGGWDGAAAREVHALLVEAYRDGGGSVPPYGAWRRMVTRDAEFDPATCFLARDRDGRLTGVCLCWSSGFVKDLCVAPPARGRGLGEALIRHAMDTFARRGHREIRLKVEAGNVGAVRLYERIGFRPSA